MSVAVTVHVVGGKEAVVLLRNISKYLPVTANNKLRKTTNNVMMDLKRNMRMAFTAPRGNLEESVKLKHKGFLNYDITMLDYGKYVDRGTDPHSVSKPYLFKPWQRRTGTMSLSNAIFLVGTRAHPFLHKTRTTDLNRRIGEFNNEFLSELRNKMKGGN